MGKSIPDRGAVAVEDFIDVVWNRTFEAILLLEHQFQSVALTITLFEPDLKRHIPGHCCRGPGSTCRRRGHAGFSMLYRPLQQG